MTTDVQTNARFLLVYLHLRDLAVGTRLLRRIEDVRAEIPLEAPGQQGMIDALDHLYRLEMLGTDCDGPVSAGLDRVGRPPYFYVTAKGHIRAACLLAKDVAEREGASEV